MCVDVLIHAIGHASSEGFRIAGRVTLAVSIVARNRRAALNFHLLAAFVAEVDQQGGCVPAQSPDPGKAFNRSEKPHLG